MTSDKEKLKLQRVKQEVPWATKIIFSGEDASKKGEEENQRFSRETSHVWWPYSYAKQERELINDAFEAVTITWLSKRWSFM